MSELKDLANKIEEINNELIKYEERAEEVDYDDEPDYASNINQNIGFLRKGLFYRLKELLNLSDNTDVDIHENDEDSFIIKKDEFETVIYYKNFHVDMFDSSDFSNDKFSGSLNIYSGISSTSGIRIYLEY